MSEITKNIHLPWHQASKYWICILPKAGVVLDDISVKLQGIGMQEVGEGDGVAYLADAPTEWCSRWQEINKTLVDNNFVRQVDVAVMSGDAPIDPQQISMSRRAPDAINEICESLWLGEALLEERLLCFLQPVMRNKEKAFGYESFARIKGADGNIVGGADIVKACRVMSMEYALDRQLHVEAVRNFAQTNLDGSLFVNFFPGFIQRPEKYLEGLSDSVKKYNVLPRNIVLDITQSEDSHDIHHIKSICDYCKKKGYAIALDDIESVANVTSLVAEVAPDFVKLDTRLAAGVEQGKERNIVKEIVNICHNQGTMVIAEGVETQEMYDALVELKVDLFQGYFFSQPVSVDKLLPRGKATA